MHVVPCFGIRIRKSTVLRVDTVDYPVQGKIKYANPSTALMEAGGPVCCPEQATNGGVPGREALQVMSVVLVRLA